MSKITWGSGSRDSLAEHRANLILHGGVQTSIHKVKKSVWLAGTGKKHVPEVELPFFGDRVRKGCILLDAITPGWMDRVDLETLDLEEQDMCILGQTYTENPMGIPGYDFEVKTYMSEFDLNPADYGFMLTDAEVDWLNVYPNDHSLSIYVLNSMVWEHLTDTWRVIINERRAAVLAREASSLG